jgi:hypothetical protein
MRVPQDYVVPWSRDWPEEFWGLRLGNVVSDIRRGRSHADKKEELEAAGFDFDKQSCATGKATGWEKVKAAFETYKTVNGDLLVPAKFVVPHDDPEWPKSTWGVNLGGIVNRIRSGKSYKDHKEELLTMGFQYVLREKRETKEKGKAKK